MVEIADYIESFYKQKRRHQNSAQRTKNKQNCT